MDDATVDAQACVRREWRMAANLVSNEATGSVEILERLADEGIDLSECLSFTEVLDESLVRLHDTLSSLGRSFNVCGLRHKHGRGNVPVPAGENRGSSRCRWRRALRGIARFEPKMTSP